MAWYLRFAALTVVAGAVLAGIGYVPTRHVANTPGLVAMVAAIAVAMLATLVGLLPPILCMHAEPLKRHNAILLGMAIRLFATMLLTTAVALSGGVAVQPLLLWVAISYMALLFVDTIAVVSLYRQLERKP
ncbi:MAG: hypothetical protein JXO22_00060 [Phycisphaerae bacterium]|nr:hypothetical protein [Phycisphaerae bacterium]